MKKLIKFSVEHPISILMYFMLTIILGIISVFALNIRFLPEVKERHILVTTEYAGVGANEIEKLITIPLEDSLSSLKGFKACESVSREGLSLIKLEVKWGTNIDVALVEAKSIVDSAIEALPQDCPKPHIQKLNLSQDEKISVCVIPKSGDIYQASDFCNEEFKSAFLELEGIGQLKINGAQSKEIQICVDKQKCAYYGISLEDIAQTVNASNYEYPAGTIQKGENDILLKTQGLYKNFSEILETPIICTENGVAKIKDIATVEKRVGDFDSFNFYNSEQCVLVEIFCKNNYSPVRLSRKISRLIKSLNAIHSDKFKIVIADDASNNIWAAIKSLVASTIAGIVITVGVLLCFFRSKKIAALIASVIPFSILFSMFVLLAAKRSVNLISLAGITICLGMIIDCSIVAILSIAKQGSIERGLEKIILSNTASTLTTIIVFIPLFFIDGIVGALFCDLSITIIAGMLFSLLFSFTVIPAAAVLFLEKDFHSKKTFYYARAQEKYRNLLKRTINLKILPAAVVCISLVFSAIFILPIKKELQPKTAQNSFSVQINFEPGTSVKKMFSSAKTIITEIQEIPLAKNILTSGGIQKKDFTELSNPQVLPERLIIKITSSNIKNTKKLVEKTLSALSLDFAFIEQGDLISNHLALENHFIFSINDDSNAKSLSLEAQEYFGANFIPNYFADGISFGFDSERLAKHNLSRTQISSAVKNSLQGVHSFPYYENGKEVPIKIQFEKDEINSERKINSLNIISQNGALPLSTLGSFSKTRREGILYRFNKKPSKIILASEQNKIQSLPDAVRKNIISLKQKTLSELFASGAALLLLVLILLYCLLGAQSESFGLPLIFLIAVPPAFFGAIFFLFIFARSLNINSILALIVLFGCSVNNSIILAEDVQSKKSVVENAVQKLDMILITTITSIAALVPFAFVFPSKNPQSSMSLAIIGGLLFSSAAVLIIVPNILFNKGAKNEFLFSQKSGNIVAGRAGVDFALFAKKPKHLLPRAKHK